MTKPPSLRDRQNIDILYITYRQSILSYLLTPTKNSPTASGLCARSLAVLQSTPALLRFPCLTSLALCRACGERRHRCGSLCPENGSSAERGGALHGSVRCVSRFETAANRPLLFSSAGDGDGEISEYSAVSAGLVRLRFSAGEAIRLGRNHPRACANRDFSCPNTTRGNPSILSSRPIGSLRVIQAPPLPWTVVARLSAPFDPRLRECECAFNVRIGLYSARTPRTWARS